MPIPVGTANILVKPSFQGFSKSVSSEMRKSLPSVGKEAGGTFGKALADGFSEGTSDVVKSAQDLSAKVASAKDKQAKASKELKAAQDQEAKAAGEVRVAELRLSEAREDSKTKTSILAKAEEDLAAKKRKLESATEKAQSATKTHESATEELTKSQKELDSATEKANAELRKTEDSTKKGRKGLKGLDKEAEKTRKTMGRFGDFLKGAFAGAIAAVSFTTITTGLKEVIDLAGEAEQATGAVDAVFKGGSAEVKANAAGAVAEVGLADTEYKKLATQFGTQLKNAGVPLEKIPGEVDRLIRQAADLSALHGGTTQEAADAMASAFRGEFDPIERYGISLRQDAINAEAAKLGYAKEGTTYGQDARVAASMSILDKQGADAKGAYAREDGTYSQQMQEFNATLQNAKEIFGQQFMPLATQLVDFMTQQLIPAFQDVSGKAAEMYENVRKFFQDNQAWIGPLAAAIGGIAGAWTLWYGAIATWTGVTKLAAGAQWLLNAAMSANPILLVVSLIAGLIAALVYLWNTNEDFRNFVIGVWQNISDFFVSVWNNHIMPMFKAIGDWITGTLVPIFVDFYNGVILPVWEGIKTAIAIAVTAILVAVKLIVDFWNGVLVPMFVNFYNGVIVPIWTGVQNFIRSAIEVVTGILRNLISFFRTHVAPVIRWIYENVVRPIFDSIKKHIESRINLVKAIFQIIINFIRNTLGPAFRWFYDKIIKPVWNGIKGTISNVWNDGIKPILDSFGSFIRDTLPKMIQKGADIIGQIWNGVKKLFATPINWVISNVINKGIVDTFNKVAKALGISARLTKMSPIALGDPHSARGNRLGPGGRLTQAAFAKGGWTGPGSKYDEAGIVHADEFVLRKEATNKLRSSVGLSGLDYMNRTGNLPIGGDGFNPLKPVGDALSWLDDRVLGGAGKKALDWVVGSLLDTAKNVMNPIMNGAKDLLGGLGPVGQLAAGMGQKLVDGLFSFTDKKEGEMFTMGPDGPVMSYNGPLGRFTVPMGGPLTSGFGAPRGKYPHAGIDIAGNLKTIRAAWDGVVERIGWNSVFGRTGIGTLLRHGNGMATYYGHQARMPGLKIGQKVRSGQPIGVSGNTGKSTGPHLHFEVWRGNTPVNPIGYLRNAQAIAPKKYDSGGWLDPGVQTVVNKTRKPEPILTAGQWQDIKTVAQQRLSVGGDEYNILVPQLAATGEDVADAIQFHTRRNKRR